jgi:hypothetical protein
MKGRYMHTYGTSACNGSPTFELSTRISTTMHRQKYLRHRTNDEKKAKKKKKGSTRTTLARG